MNSRTLWCLVVLFGALVNCISAADDLAHVPKHVSLPGEPVTVPLVVDQGVLLIEVQINGRGPYRFVLDTGSQAMVISAETAESLQLQDTGRAYTMQTPGGELVRAAKAVHVKKLDIGGARFADFTAIVQDFSGYREMGYVRSDGVIGIGCFTRSLLTVDIPNRQITISKGRLATRFGPRMKQDRHRRRSASANNNVYRWASQSKVPTMPVQIASRGRTSGTYHLKVDTGYNQGFGFPQRIQDEPFRLTAQGEAQSVTIAGRRVSQYFQLDAAVAIGKIGRIESPIVEISNDTGRVGTGVLQYLAFTIDRDHRLIQLGER